MTAITSTYRFTGVGEDFGPRADGIVTLHTTESSFDRLRVVDAISLAKWQDRDDILGSYNRLICVDGALSTVPDDHASGGINPGSSHWAPKAWLYDFLDRDEIANPNFFTLNLSAMGQRAWFDANGWPPSIIDGFARSIIDEERRIGRGVVVTNHADFQSNRSDAGAICMDLVMKRYHELTATPLPDTALPPENPMIIRQPIVTEWWDTIAGPASTFIRPDGSTDHFTAKVRVKSIAEITLPDGTDARLLDYLPNHEALIIRRKGMTPVPGSRIVGSPEPTTVVDPAQAATIAQQADRIADLQTALGHRDATIVKKNQALDVAIAHEKPHADLAAQLQHARAA